MDSIDGRPATHLKNHHDSPDLADNEEDEDKNKAEHNVTMGEVKDSDIAGGENNFEQSPREVKMEVVATIDPK